MTRIFSRGSGTRLPPAERKCLKLARVGQRDTTIVELDIEEATQAAYKAQRKLLLDYYHDGNGDPRDVVQKIRPVLESYGKILGATCSPTTIRLASWSARSAMPARPTSCTPWPTISRT